MDKLQKFGSGNAPPAPKISKQATTDDLNKVVTKVNDIIDNLVEFVDITTTTYTIKLTDSNRYLKISNADAITVTLPTYEAVPILVGTIITIEQTGAGAITVQGDTGVTVNGLVLSGGQYNILVLIKTSFNTWTCIGGTE